MQKSATTTGYDSEEYSDFEFESTGSATGNEQDDGISEDYQLNQSIYEAMDAKDVRGKLERVTPEMVQYAHQLFPRLSIESLSGTNVVDVSECWGTNPTHRPSPYQIVFAAWAFKTERSLIGGGLLADSAGLGKTLMLILVWLVNRHHYRNRREVRMEWKHGKSSDHFLEDAPKGSRRPTEHKQRMACWCVPDNRATLYSWQSDQHRSGLTLAVTQPSGMGAFHSELTKLFAGSELMHPREGVRIALHSDIYERDPLFLQLTQDEANQYCKVGDWALDGMNETRRDSKNKRECPGHWELLSDTSAKAIHIDATKTQAPSKASGVLIITTRACTAGIAVGRLPTFPRLSHTGTHSMRMRRRGGL
ncbi:hypothetical protein GQ44DRAFT_134370 [Phaeosphaeriaceae sp. PMI808]|nr:hypothetical protein GQ44DRAFT_134370 [Phaeosphaeriaceae sp. PMI808]